MNIRRPIVLMTALLAAALITGTAKAQAPQWKSVAPASFDESVSGFTFPTADTGFATSWSFDPTVERGTLLRTVNRGVTWTKQALNDVSPTDVWFTNKTYGFVTGKGYGCDCPVLLVTTNGGTSWDTKPYTGTGSLEHLFFLDTRTGFATGDSSMLLMTTNGGAEWTRVNVANSNGVDFREIQFPTATTGYMLGADRSRGIANIVFKTVDGGANWSRVFDGGTPVANGMELYDLYFVDDNVGIFAGRAGTQAMYRTTDGGRTMTRVFTPAATAGPGAMSVVEFITPTLGYAAGSEGLVLRTTDAGLTWKSENSGTANPLTAISVLDDNTVVVGGILGTMRRRTAAYSPKLSLSLNRLDFGEPTEPTELSLKISPANPAGLRVEALEIDNKNLGFSIVAPTTPAPHVLPAGGELTVTIRFTPDESLPQTAITDLMISTNDGAEPVVRVGLKATRGEGESPAAVLSLDSVGFTATPINRPSEQTLTIEAANSAPVTVFSLEIDAPNAAGAFTVLEPATLPATVRSGTPLNIRVRFAPTRTGAHRGTLVVRTNDGAEPEQHVALAGTGTEPVAGVGGATGATARLSVDAAPNPMKGAGLITISVPERAHVLATMYNVLGERVATMFDGTAEAGPITLEISARTLAKGFYYCIVEAGGQRAVKEVRVVR